MAPLTPAVADKVEVLANIETVLAWNLNGPDHPSVEAALSLVRQLTAYGRIIADDLRTRAVRLPADSHAGRGAQATLSEASRRLHLSFPASTPQAAGRRAQNVARLVKALLRATGDVDKEQAPYAGRSPRFVAHEPARRRKPAER